MRMELGENFVGLFCDPGAEHTGFAVVQVKNRTFEILSAGEVNGLVESGDLVPYAIKTFGARLFCYEGFRLYQDKADAKVHSEFEEIQTIGAMLYAAFPYRQSLHIHKQFAYQIKIPPFSDRALKTMGLNTRMFFSNHTRDAFRHFLRYWCFELKYGYPRVIGTYGEPARAVLTEDAPLSKPDPSGPRSGFRRKGPSGR